MMHWFDSGFVFEEVLSRRLTGLYGFALFVTGGRPDRAEALLLDVVERAFERHLDGEDAAAALDRSLVTEAVRAPEPVTSSSNYQFRPTPGDLRTIPSIEPAMLRRATLKIPLPARVAIWLVVVERRTYTEVGDLLGVDRDGLCTLLAWRDAMVGLALAEARGHDGHVSTGS
jgi:DNA-directed RNA polymerase specialized sigma24 family protein